MKLFYQLASAEQDQAISHCAELVVANAVENGLEIEAQQDEESRQLKTHLDDLFEQLKEAALESKNDRIEFLMQDEVFSDTVLELASEMAYNAFYHESNELVIFTDSLSKAEADGNVSSDSFDDDDDDDDDFVEYKTPPQKKLLN